ncbi:MAG: hypothetical protein J6R34_00065 [Clostridia bacterium]|nr:hypothetical protein [Clostridia bacterium]
MVDMVTNCSRCATFIAYIVASIIILVCANCPYFATDVATCIASIIV